MKTALKYLILVTLLYRYSAMGYAQRIVADDVVLLHTNVFAAMNSRLDEKGKPCAVLLLQSTLPNLKFYGNVVGEVDKKQSTYYIYLKPGTNKLKVVSAGGSEVSIKFDKVQSKKTYEVTLHEMAGAGSLYLSSDPSGATVKLVSGDDVIDLGRTPLKGEMKVLEGEYLLILSKPGYSEVSKKITIKPNKELKIGTIKLKKQT